MVGEKQRVVVRHKRFDSLLNSGVPGVALLYQRIWRQVRR